MCSLDIETEVPRVCSSLAG